MQLDVLITASPIPSHPRIDIVKETILSLGKLEYDGSTVLNTCKIVIAHDAPRGNTPIKTYELYLANLREWAMSQNYDIELVVAQRWGCLVGNIRHGFEFVSSEYVLIVQHDMPFLSTSNPIDMAQVIQDMETEAQLKCVRFNKRKNTKVGFDAVSNLFGKQLKAENYTYTRTGAWSDNNHLCKSAYYTEMVLKECKDGQFMERILHPKAHKSHAKYGMYLYGPLNAPASIAHTDGKNKK